MKTKEAEKLTTVGTKLTLEEKALFVQLAKINRRSQSQLLRDWLRDEARNRGLWPPSGHPLSRQVMSRQIEAKKQEAADVRQNT